jgi:very-short-patch-repair endonuclease
MSSSQKINTRIAALARSYDGLVPTRELRQHGVDVESIKRRTDSGLLIPVCRGIRILAGVELTHLRRAMAAVLTGGIESKNAWISHTSALRYYNATLKSQRTAAEISSVRRVRIGKVLAHEASEYPTDLGLCFGIPVSRPWFAIIESASVLTADELAVAMDSLVQARHVSFDRVNRAIEDAGLFRGRVALGELLTDRLNGMGLVRSFLERDLEAVLRKAKLPAPKRNFEVRLPSGRKRILDAAWPDVKRCLEADSWQHHSNPSQWGATRIRDRELSALGWTVIPVVVADTRDPSNLVTHLRALFTEDSVSYRAPLPGN